MQSNLMAKHPLDSAETVPMSPEAAQQLLLRLSKVPETSGQLRKTIGSQFVAEYFQIVGAAEVVEMDWQSLSGQMSHNQLAQYNALSGEYELTMGRLATLAKKITAHFFRVCRSWS